MERTNAGARAARIVLLLCVMGATVFVLSQQGGERGAIEKMPAAQRSALYQKRLAAFEALCGGQPVAQLEPRCRDEAALLRQFPECDPACRAATARWQSRPTR